MLKRIVVRTVANTVHKVGRPNGNPPKPVVLHFSKRDQAQLADMLINPPPPNERLRKLHERYLYTDAVGGTGCRATIARRK